MGGRPGNPGLPGAPGLEGLGGVAGPPGIQGPQGDMGPSGPRGKPGKQGATGPQGIAGSAGDKGCKGDNGPSGPAGEPGHPGNDGVPGTPGQNGAKGEAGEQGPRGYDGPQGQPGLAGPRGHPGEKGPPAPLVYDDVLAAFIIDTCLSIMPTECAEVVPDIPKPKCPVCHAHAYCGDDYQCYCNNGYEGNGINCVEIVVFVPPCANHNCHAHAVCVERGDSYSCICNSGLEGDGYYCEEIVHPCELLNCHADAVCIEDYKVGWHCRCNEGLLGDGHICAADTVCPPCEQAAACDAYPVNVVFLIDGSASISDEDFDEARDWILTVVDTFNPAQRPVPLKITIVQFSDTPVVETEQFVYDSSDEVYISFVQLKGRTNTYHALDFVNTEVFPMLEANTFKLLITMTDGEATDSPCPCVKKARKNFDMMYVVGIGSEVHHDKLVDLATAESHVGRVDDFAHLSDIVHTMHGGICDGIYNVVQARSENPYDVVKRYRRSNTFNFTTLGKNKRGANDEERYLSRMRLADELEEMQK